MRTRLVGFLFAIGMAVTDGVGAINTGTGDFPGGEVRGDIE